MSDGTDWVFKPAELDEFLADKGNNALLGIRYNAHASDWIELAMPWDERFIDCHATGTMSNGAIMTLMDNAAGCSIYLKRGGFLPQVTIDLRTDYLRPTHQNSTLIARSSCFQLTGSTALTRTIAYDDNPDEPACHAIATFMLL